MRFFMVIITIIFFFTPFVYGKNLIIAADKWEPINGDPGSDKPGYVIELANKIFSAAGYQVEYLIVPWARAIASTEDGKYNAVIGATKENSTQLLIPNEPFGILNNSYFTDKLSNWNYHGPKSLKNEKIGVILGYKYGDIQPYLNAKRGTVSVQFLGGNNPLINNFRKLFSGRITVLVDWQPVVDYTAQLNGWSDSIRFAGEGGNRTPLFLGFADDQEALLEIWDKGIQQLKKNGSFKKIVKKYGISMQSIGF